MLERSAGSQQTEQQKVIPRVKANVQRPCCGKTASKEQHERTKFFFSLPTSSVSHFVPELSPKPKIKRQEVCVSRFKPGDIFAVPFVSSDVPGVSVLYLGEVVEAAKVLSSYFFTTAKLSVTT